MLRTLDGTVVVAVVVVLLVCCRGFNPCLAAPTGSNAAAATRPSAAQPDPDLDPAEVPRDAILLEVVPPQWVRQSAGADQLWQRIVQKHVLLLGSPDLSRQVFQNPNNRPGFFRKHAGERPDPALHNLLKVRAIRGTSIIAVSVDRIAGDDAPILAQLLAEQHLENEKTKAQNRMLEESVMLNNLKQRYQFRSDELNRELREQMTSLSIDEGAAATRPADAHDKAEIVAARDRIELLKEDRRRTRDRLNQLSEELEEISQRSGQSSEPEVLLLRLPVK